MRTRFETSVATPKPRSGSSTLPQSRPEHWAWLCPALALQLIATLPSDTATSDTAEAATCKRLGRRWQLTLASRSVLVEDSIGMLHLAVLVANPRREILGF